VTPSSPEPGSIGRRDAIAVLLATGAALAAAPGGALAEPAPGKATMKLACIIRYQIDPFQRDGFETHARNLIRAVPRSGGHLVGFFVPHEGTNDVAWALVLVESLAAYEAYRERMKADPEAREDAARMQARRIILREERNFVELVDGTFNLLPRPF
jgi:NIPSNAP protein